MHLIEFHVKFLWETIACVKSWMWIDASRWFISASSYWDCQTSDTVGVWPVPSGPAVRTCGVYMDEGEQEYLLTQSSQDDQFY